MFKIALFFRSLVFVIVQALSAMIIATIALVLFFLPYRWRYRLITSWSWIVIWSARVLCGIRYHVEGLEHLPSSNAIVLCKHQSAWETLFLQTLLPPQTWVLKKELLRIPFFGWAIRLIDPIAIDRKKARMLKEVLDKGTFYLKQGRWVVLFPEGTRVPVGHTGRYAKSGAQLAKHTGYPIVPIAHNAGICWPKGFLKRPGIIQVRIGPWIDPAPWSLAHLHEHVQTWIEETVRQLPAG